MEVDGAGGGGAGLPGAVRFPNASAVAPGGATNDAPADGSAPVADGAGAVPGVAKAGAAEGGAQGAAGKGAAAKDASTKGASVKGTAAPPENNGNGVVKKGGTGNA
eukprot:contig_6750_g1555